MSEFFNLVASLQTSLDALNAILAGDENTTVIINDQEKPSLTKKAKETLDGVVQVILDAAADIDAVKYGSTVTGIAATSDGDYFSVISANESNYLDLYLNNANTAEFIKSYPSDIALKVLDSRVDGVGTNVSDLLISAMDLYEADTDHIIVVAATNEDGQAQSLVSYDLVNGKLLHKGTVVLDEEDMPDYLAGHYAPIEDNENYADVESVLPIIATNHEGVTTLPVAYDMNSESLLVNGAQMGITSPLIPNTKIAAKIEGDMIVFTGDVVSEGVTEPVNASLPVFVAIREPSEVQTSLIYSTDTRFYINPNVKLDFSIVENLVVTRDSDGQELIEDVDYKFIPLGIVTGLIDTADFDVTITYDGVYQRYITYLYDIVNKTIFANPGNSRKTDPEEYIPPNDTGSSVPIFNTHIGDVVELINLQGWVGDNYMHDNMHHFKERNKRILAKTRAKMIQGGNITLIGYGDSITCFGGFADHTIPNGTARDDVAFFSDYPDDTFTKIPVYDFNDGGGLKHVKEGWNWILKHAIEDRYGATVNYLNYGIGGTASGSDLNSNGRPNGLYPERIQYPLADTEVAIANGDAVLVVLAFGMNELGQVETAENTAEMAKKFKAKGADVIILDSARPNPLGRINHYEKWQSTSSYLYSAAISTDSAFVPFAPYITEERLGFLGMSSFNLAGAGRVNHPGRREFGFFGKLLINNIL